MSLHNVIGESAPVCAPASYEMLNELKHIAAAVNRMANQSAQQLENDKKQDVTLATIIAKQGNMELFLNNLNELVVKHISPSETGQKLLK